MHNVLLLIATLTSFTVCQSERYLSESAAVASFVEYLAGPLPSDTVNNFCQPESSQMMLWKGVEYTCEMNAEERVTKLEVVAVVGNHRYPRHYVYVPTLGSSIRDIPRPAFDVFVLNNLPSLTYLYPMYLNVGASRILGLLTKITSQHKSGA